MFNVAVVNIKEILKYLVSITVTLCLVLLITRYFSGLKENEQFLPKLQTTLLFCLDETIPGIKETNHELNNQNEDLMNENTILGSLLKIELSMFKEEQKIAHIQNVSTNQVQEVIQEEIIEQEKTSDEITIEGTEVVTQNPLVENYNSEYQSVKIKNETSFELTEEMLSQRIEVNKENIVIFHTHTCESYTSSENYPYVPTGNYRTTDINYSVAKVGAELTKYLQSYNYNVIHNCTYHDYPAYSGSYNRSLNTV